MALNAFTFCLAFPETSKPESGPLARDFSAYYIGEWRLFHNPNTIYYGGALPGDYQILPAPQTFKYDPSFLIFFSPFLLLSYQNALTVFDIIQFALVPVLAFFVYRIVKDKDLVFAATAAFIILIEPLPTPPLNQAALNLLHYRFFSLNAQSFSPAYYVGYSLANAHILQTALLVGALYFGFTKKPWLSALLFAFSISDPRASLLAIPLLLWYNRKQLLSFIISAVSFVAITNVPFFFYHDIGLTFLRSETSSKIVSQMYPYDWIPIYAVIALSIIEIINAAPETKLSLSLKRRTQTLLSRK
ncbi:MAG TPA: glycosyltransferase family 87 protein [Candidatus Acidoferrum sp.]|nr:glycosyltransferase family 87 protein [Candidatus Acidoferrum sp.]